MKITKIEKFHPATIAYELGKVIAESRFKAVIDHEDNSVNIGKVRLKSSKEYCGNHAKACENIGKIDRKSAFLEGADWVEFNDLVNHTLDSHQIAAFVASAKGAGCIIRKGKKRRIRYDADTFIGEPGRGEWRWNYDAPDNHFRNCFKKLDQISKFPKGTPGIYTPTNYFTIG